MDILILVAAVLLIGLFCYKNVPTLIGGIVCSVILMIIYKMNIVDGLFDTYMGGLVGFMKSWMILFFLGALFGKLLDVTGGSDSLARVILNLVGPKNVSLGVCLFTAILAMAGISSFISLFICYPIALKLCRRANINRRLLPRPQLRSGHPLGARDQQRPVRQLLRHRCQRGRPARPVRVHRVHRRRHALHQVV